MIRAITLGFVSFFAIDVSQAATYTVAPSGGDFTTIQAAIDAAVQGDVIRVLYGTYSAFTLTKDLAILGVPTASHPRPRTLGESTIQTSAPRIGGLEIPQLVVRNVTGVALLDDLEITGGGCAYSLLVENCTAVHVARSEIYGKDGDPSCEGPAIRVRDSVLTITASLVVGGDGWGDDFVGYDGQPAIIAQSGARVLLVGSDGIGGNGGWPDILFGGIGGNGASAIQLDTNGPIVPRVTFRGSIDDRLEGGKASLGIGAIDPTHVVIGSGGTLTFSGGTHWPSSLASLGITQLLPVPAEPFSTLVGSDLPNGFKRLSLHGPAGAPTLVLVGTAAAHLPAPAGVIGTLFVAPGSIITTVPATLTGQDLAINWIVSLPPSLLGLENTLVTVQAFTGGVAPGGAWFAQNPTYLLLRG